jgi:hypothetical protein
MTPGAEPNDDPSPAQRPLETDSELLEPSATIPLIPPTRPFPGVIRSWRPNLTERIRKARVRSSRVHHDLRRPGALSRAQAGLLIRCAGWCRWVVGLFRRSETGCFRSKASRRRIGPAPSGAPLGGGDERIANDRRRVRYRSRSRRRAARCDVRLRLSGRSRYPEPTLIANCWFSSGCYPCPITDDAWAASDGPEARATKSGYQRGAERSDVRSGYPA